MGNVNPSDTSAPEEWQLTQKALTDAGRIVLETRRRMLEQAAVGTVEIWRQWGIPVNPTQGAQLLLEVMEELCKSDP